MATPPYLGATSGIAVGDNWFARLTSNFASSGTPIYAGAGQPSPYAAGVLQSSSSPIYAAAPANASETAPSDATQAVELQCFEDSCPIDPAALAAGQIAIVIPRDRLGP
ncbi:MAG: hypothetical protein ACKV2T_04420 [Kofleriaceae bacterium]